MAVIPEQGSTHNAKAANAGVQLADIPRIDAVKLATAAVDSREKLAGLVKRKKDEEDDFQNAGDEVVTTEDGVAAAQDGPILLAQAETAGAEAASSAAGGGATGTGAVSGGAASAGTAAGGAAGAEAAAGLVFSDAALGTMILAGTVGVAAAASGGGSAAAAAVVSNIVAGTIVAGPVVGAHGLTVQLYQADGTTALGTPGTVDANGQFSINVGSYSGVVIARVINAGAGADYIDEASGQAVNLTANLMAVGVAGGGTVTLNINPLTTVAAIKAGADATTGVPAAALTSTAVNDANTAVATTFGLTNLTGEAVVTTVTSTGAANSSYDSTNGLTNAEKYGAVLASLSGMDTTGNTQNTITTLVAGLTVTGTGTGATGSLDSATLDALVVGATTAAPNTAGSLLSTLSETLSQTNSSVSIDVIATDNAISAAEAGAVITLAGTNAAGATVALSIGGAAVAATVTGTTWSYTLQPTDYIAMGEGAEAISATATLTTGTGATATTTTATASRVIAIDTVAPTLTITSDVPAVRAGQTATISFTFSEAPSGFAAGDILTTGGTLSNPTVTANPKVYTAIFTPTPDTASGTASITVAAGVYLDAIGNNGGAGTTPTINIDTLVPVAPTVTVVAADATAAEATAGAVTVNGENSASVAITFTGMAGNVTKTVTGTGTAQAVALTAGEQSTLGQGAVTVSAVATDAAGNASTAGTGSFNLDTVLPNTPTVTVVAADATAAEATAGAVTVNAENGASVAITITGTAGNFTKTVTGTGTAQAVALTLGEQSTTLGQGAVTVSAVVTDAAGNVSAAGTGGFTLDTVLPSISSGTTGAVDENSPPTTVVYTAAATDTNAITYSLSGADAGLFSIAANGNVTFNSSPNFEARPNNVYNLTVNATDVAGNMLSQNVAITVNNLNEAPTVVQGAPTSITLAVNQAFNDTIANMFADQDANTTWSYSATGLPGTITLDPGTGAISGTPNQTGTANIVITASDGLLSVSHNMAVNVVAAPVISAIAPNVAQAKSGDALTFTATVSEAVTVTGTPTLTLDIGGTPVTATYTGGTGSASLTFTATAPATVSDNTVTVTAINLNGGTVTGNTTQQPLVTATTGQVVASFVVDNAAPAFASATAAPNVAENQTSVYTAAATDATGVTYTLGGTDAGLFNIANGVVTFKTAPNFEAPTDNGGNGVYDITVTATDALGHTANQNVAITVNNVNEAPTSTAITANAAPRGSAYSFSVAGNFADPDANTLTYSSTPLPTGLTLDPGTGVISGTATTLGTTSVTVTATDNGVGALSASQTFNLVVADLPTLSSTIDNVANLEVTSDIVLTASGSGAVTAVANKSIHIVNDANDVTNAGFHGEATTNTQDILVTDTAKVTITNNTITINPGFDLDFANNYHITVDAGAFTVAGLGTVAVSDVAAMNFATVLPSATATATVSSAMVAGTDAVVAGHSWWDAEGFGVPGGAPVARDFGVNNGNLAIAANDLATTGIATNDFYIAVNNFAAGDLIYVDNHGDNAVQRQADFNNGLIIDMGVAPTSIITSASNTATGQNGGQFDVTVAGSAASFADTSALQVLLGNVTYQPVLYG